MGDNAVRQRNVSGKEKRVEGVSDSRAPSSEETSRFSATEIARIIVMLILLGGGLSWFVTGESFIWNWRQLPTLVGQAQRYFKGPVRLTEQQLALYNGTDPSLPIYVALNSSIYDVSASPNTYGPGGSYSFFSGRDATRAFLTGCFQEDLTPDIRGVEEMYMPLDPEDEVISNAERKTRRERDMRLARKQIEGTISHWDEVFRGKTGRPYFYVGEVKREEGWLEKLERRELCGPAREGRPKRADIEKKT